MDTQPRRPDGVSDLERRLAACAPSADGLDADAMLFAAGRASARPDRARFVWPALTAALAVTAAVLGVWLAAERAGRIELARKLQQSAPVPQPPAVAPVPPAAPEPPTANQPPTSSVLASHQALEQGLDAWPPAPVSDADPPGPPRSDPPVLRVGRPDSLPDL
jgi:hypothetical protein